MEYEPRLLSGLMASRIYSLSKSMHMKCIITDEEEGTPQSIVIIIGQEEPIRSYNMGFTIHIDILLT